MTSLQDRILDAALPDIAFDGWTDSVLERAAQKAGLHKADVSRAFPSGVFEALEYFTQRGDARMSESLKRDYNLASMKVRERITTCVLVRLKQNLPYREAIRRGVAVYALPWHAAAGLRALYRTMDEMWHLSGDTATDWNHYSKRIILSKVYMSTLYVWLSDDSPNLAETEAFLRRRIDNVMQFEKFKAKVKSWRAA
ncbi:MAG: COQ9 family protein [Rickettsiales bacterium]